MYAFHTREQKKTKTIYISSDNEYITDMSNDGVHFFYLPGSIRI